MLAVSSLTALSLSYKLEIIQAVMTISFRNIKQKVMKLYGHRSCDKKDNSFMKIPRLPMTTMCIIVRDLLPGVWYPTLCL